MTGQFTAKKFFKNEMNKFRQTLRRKYLSLAFGFVQQHPSLLIHIVLSATFLTSF